jgi:DNA-binding NarL/FixJ family response regulator
MIRILLVDDHDLVRTGIRRVLDDESGMQVVGEASSGEEALEAVRGCQPDVVLMDVGMPGMGGLEATRRMLRHRHDLKVVGLTAKADLVFPRRLLEAGAIGYVTKGCGAEELIAAIHAAYRGRQYLSQDVAQSLALEAMQGTRGPLGDLSEKEFQVMEMIAHGRSTQEIAEGLFLSPKTVSTYRSRIFRKLNVGSDVELALVALRYGLVEPEAREENPPYE